MDDRQRKHLEDHDRRYVWHPFTQMKDYEQEIPLIIERGEGFYLYDIYGQRYLDGVSSLWVNVHGHAVPALDEALHAQIGKLAHSTLLGLGNVPSIMLAERLVGLAPRGLAKVFYSDNGSTAVEVAIKMAYQYWQNIEGPQTKRTRIAHLSNAYHGDTIGSVSVGGMPLFHHVYEKLLFNAVAIPVPESYRYTDAGTGLSWEEACVDELCKTISAHAHELAAVVVEPLVQGAAGMLLLPDGYLKKLRTLCDQYGVLLILDEVATGFGRTGTMFACEQEQVCPDILTVAKGLTGGYLPVAATLTTRKVYDAFYADYAACKTFFHGHTYTGNPLGCAVALANLDLLEKNAVLAHVQAMSVLLKEKLKRFQGLSHVGDVRQRGLMVGIELVRNKTTKEPYDWAEKMGIKVILEARRRGVILRPLGPVIVLMPPLAIGREDLEFLLEVTYDSISAVTSA